MELEEAIKRLNAAGLIVEDTDELDDADLPVGMNAKQYHKQKAKMLSLLDKVQLALNNQSAKAQAKIKKYIPVKVKRWIAWLEWNHEGIFPGDYKGDWFLDTKNVEGAKKQHKFKDESETLLWCFNEGMKMHGRDKTSKADYYRKLFKENWLPLATKLIKGKTVKVYRGMSFDDGQLKDFSEGILATLTKNVLSRNSWTFNRKVAKEYASLDECGIIMSMDCSLDQLHLYYSAWLEGYWAGYGSTKTRSPANDEFNLKKIMNLSNVKIVHYDSTDYYSKKLFNQYFSEVI